jgi:hypothetical protein
LIGDPARSRLIAQTRRNNVGPNQGGTATMKKFSVGALAGVLATTTIALLGLLAPASAVTVQTGSGTIAAGDPVEIGRVTRDSVASTWAAPKSFPGLNDLDPHFYDLVTVSFAPNASQNVFYEISWRNDTNLTTESPHLVAYVNSFNPASVGTNYLGDRGSTPFKGSIGTFQVIVPTGGTLILVFQDVPNTGLHQDASYSFQVDAFSDAQRAENFSGAVPLPAALPLFATGLGALGLFGWRRKRKAQAA